MVNNTTPEAWIQSRRTTLQPSIKRISWKANGEWSQKKGVFVHQTARFFQICGLEFTYEGHCTRIPMIDQPEVGLLAFLVHKRHQEVYWLVQAKLEPGNVGFVQMAPTVQATESNYQQIHGGSPTLYLEYFENRDTLLVNNISSEQGTKFIHKFNRNAIRIVEEKVAPYYDNWMWVSSEDLRGSLRTDFLINTDARSVISCSPWNLLKPENPLFTIGKHNSDIPPAILSALSESYYSGNPDIAGLIAKLTEQTNQNQLTYQRISLEMLADWEKTEDSFRHKGRTQDFQISNYRVFAPGREVEHWDQPLLEGLSENKSYLVFQIQGGVLKVFLSYAREPGFGQRVEYGPSWQSDSLSTHWLDHYPLNQYASPLLHVRQSDEGGRFMNMIMTYSLFWLPEHLEVPNTETYGVWVDLAGLQALCLTPGTLTNEARSATSVLLSLI